jgi:hypothetical protein
MRTFELTFKGSDHLVKWVSAEDRSALDKWLEEESITPYLMEEPNDGGRASQYETGVDYTVGGDKPVDIDKWKTGATDPQLERVKAKYEPKIIDALNKLRAYFLVEAAYVCGEVWEMEGDDEYNWVFIVNIGNPDEPGKWHERNVDVNIRIVEQAVHEGLAGPGISFRVDLGGDGGRIVGQYAPYNFTPEWVVDMFDDDAVEQRFTDVVSALDGALACIQEYVEKYPDN